MEQLIWVILIVVVAVAAGSILKWLQAEKKSDALLETDASLRAQLDTARDETNTAKEALKKKSKQFDDVKAESKKKARRDGRKENRQSEVAKANALDTETESAEIKKLKKAIAALEEQVGSITGQNEADLKDARRQHEGELKEAQGQHEGELKEAGSQARVLEDELVKLKTSIKKKKEARPGVPGTQLDLKALPVEAVQELSRYFRKGEEYERLYSVAQGQLNLAKERNGELQKRYFAVCREMAVLATGNEAITEAEAESAVSEIVQQADGLARKNAERSKAEPVEAPKKKHRSRRKKSVQKTKAPAAAEGASKDSKNKRRASKDDGASTTRGSKTADSAPAEAADPSGSAEKVEAGSTDSSAADTGSAAVPNVQSDETIDNTEATAPGNA